MAAPATRRALLVAAALALLVFAALAAGVVTHSGGGLDGDILEWVRVRRTPAATWFLTRFTRLGSWYILGPVAAVTALALVRSGMRRQAEFLALCLGTSVLLNITLKAIVQRQPPGATSQLLPASLYAFPSGHTMSTTAFALALVVIAWPTQWRWPVLVGGVAGALTMGLSRVYAAVHWPSDVVAGWLMGAAVVAVVAALLPPHRGEEGQAGKTSRSEATAAADAPRPGTTSGTPAPGTTSGTPARGITTSAPGLGAAADAPVRVVLFDWGNTLMVDDGQPGPMAEWPRVAAVPGAAEALAALHGRYRLCVATNADDSGADEVMAALGRVGLARLVDRVFSSRDIGARKPDPAFYASVLGTLRSDAPALGGGTGDGPGDGAAAHSLRADEVVMVGDDYGNDIAGAAAAGMRAIWFNPGRTTRPGQRSAADAEIHSFEELPSTLSRL